MLYKVKNKILVNKICVRDFVLVKIKVLVPHRNSSGNSDDAQNINTNCINPLNIMFIKYTGFTETFDLVNWSTLIKKNIKNKPRQI